MSALDIQWEYFDRVTRYAQGPGFPPEVQRAVDRWEYLLTGLEKDPLSLDREVDWVIKYRLLEEYRERRGATERMPGWGWWIFLSRCGYEPRALLRVGAARAGRQDRHGRAGVAGTDQTSPDDPRPLAGRFHQGGPRPTAGTSRWTGCISS